MVGPEGFSEEQWELLTREALAEQDWQPLNGVAIAPGSGERVSWGIPSYLGGCWTRCSG